jgi:hypothetical protein
MAGYNTTCHSALQCTGCRNLHDTWPEWQWKAQGGAARGNNGRTTPEGFDVQAALRESIAVLTGGEDQGDHGRVPEAPEALRETARAYAHDDVAGIANGSLAAGALQGVRGGAAGRVLSNRGRAVEVRTADAAFTEHWTMFLRMLKKHGANWEPSDYRIGEATDEHPARQYETRPAPVLDAGFEAAIETAFGCDIKAARRALIQEHPMFGGVLGEVGLGCRCRYPNVIVFFDSESETMSVAPRSQKD